MSCPPFVPLHVHTEYSLLDGANRIVPLVHAASAFHMPAIAMTDHGNMFGAIAFYRAATEAGVKPIIGCEAYLAPRSRFDKELSSVADDDYAASSVSTPYYHLILLCANETGYRNLMKLLSIAQMEGFYHKPRIDKDVLRQYSAGLLGLSGCLRGEIPYLLSRSLEKEATDALHTYRDIFGKDGFFIEVQENGLEIQTAVNARLVAFAKQWGVPIVATNDCHYLHQHDARAHDIMLCLQTGKTVNMPNRMRFQTDSLYFKSPDEMVAAFAALPEAVSNTVRIASMVDLTLKFGAVHLPHYDVPPDMTHQQYLQALTMEGLNQRLSQMPDGGVGVRGPYETRLAYELQMINAMGYAGYFLIVWDIMRYARSEEIPVGPGRGSAAGSLVAYALGITNIDPIPHGLIFERFLNPERVTLPDIDMDFCMNRREEVIRYVTQKFGNDRVCQIITFGTMAARAAIRDVGRALEVPYADVDQLAKLIPDTLNITLDEAIAKEPKLSEAISANPTIAEVLTLAKRLEGLVRHASTHAAGVVISPSPLTDYTPLYRGSKGETVTQYAMDDIEKVGLIKFDFLGLRTLTVIDDAVRRIRQTHPTFDISNIRLDDLETYALMGTGKTTGIFQLESRGMRDLLMKMRPETFEDIIAILALYRPGPIGSGMLDDFIKRRRGGIKIHYDVPAIEPILKDTYGVMVYQEQVMEIAHVLAGFSLGEADLLRRAMGKKKPEEMAKQKTRFVEGAIGRGISTEKAHKIFDLMEYFSGYGFNKSHSAAYALITYQTAYLKCHYPRPFMAALLTTEVGNTDKGINDIGECRRMGIVILPPDINESGKDFTVVPEGIRFGLAAVKNVGGGAVDAILASREQEGRFSSLFDFCRKTDPYKINKRVIESLIKCGAFDAMGVTRSGLMEMMEQAIQIGGQRKRAKEGGQMSLFETDDTDPLEYPPVPEWDNAQVAKFEKEMLGFYITHHPLLSREACMREYGVIPIETLPEIPQDREVSLAGVIGQTRTTITKRGDRMAYLRLEDLTGFADVIVFPDLYKTASELFVQDAPVVITGTLDNGEKGIKIKAIRIVPMTAPTDSGATTALETIPYVIHLSEADTPPTHLIALKEILRQFPGTRPVQLHLSDKNGKVTVIALQAQFDVSGRKALDDAIKRLNTEAQLIPATLLAP